MQVSEMMSVGEIAERLRRSTVQVISGTGAGTGSGIVWKAAGGILTNAHVASDASAQVVLWDGKRLPAKIVKRDERRDLAALQIPTADLTAVSIGDSGSLHPGEVAIAVGNPLGFVGAVSTGVIHAVGPLPGFGRRRWVQSDVRLAPGNSGGPLVNTRGELIGVNTMIARSRAAGSLALAIPSSTVLDFLNGSVDSAVTVGITVTPVALSRERALGFLILETQPGFAADRASLLIGDLLIGASGQRFRKHYDLEQAIESASDRLSLQFRRGAAPNDRSVTLQLNRQRVTAA